GGRGRGAAPGRTAEPARQPPEPQAEAEVQARAPSPTASPDTTGSRALDAKDRAQPPDSPIIGPEAYTGGSGCGSPLIDGGRPWRSPCSWAPKAAASSASCPLPDRKS